jgi:antitoxin (DNA-binding transcriptional repressor) of toxin-antitoxin stability system
MRSVRLKVLKTRLNQYVRIAAAGETVQVTDGNRVVAELVPPKLAPERTVIPFGQMMRQIEADWDD